MRHQGDKPIAKLSRPDAAGLFARERLLAALDGGARQPVTWVSGPAGSGKSSLVASYVEARGLPCLWYRLDARDADVATFFYYLGLAARRAAPRLARRLPLLTPEYLPGLDTFARRFFEALCAAVAARPFAIVLDDYQEVPEGSRFHDALREGLYAVPEGVRVLVMSRGAPPASLARLQASGSVSHVGWRELRFTPDEVSALAAATSGGRGADAPSTALLERAEGWAAGIVLLLARAATLGNVPVSLGRSTPEEVFQFFAGELFEKTDDETRTFLLRSSPLPTMTAASAAELTGNRASERILAALSRRHFFTEVHVSETERAYRYHPLFREFLLLRAEETLPRDEHLALKGRAAALLERSGQAEPAADLLIGTGDWASLDRLVRGWAPTLIAQGRTPTLVRWLRSFPAERVAQSPWLEHFTGACLLSSDPAESRRHFEQAFASFGATTELDGLFLSWAGAMEALLLGWGDFSDGDRWIEVLERLLREGIEPPTRDIWARVTTSMLFALTLRQPHHPDILSWVERARRIAADGTDPRVQGFVNVYLELYYLWVGDHAGAELVLRGVREATASHDASPLARILGRIIEAVYRVRMAEHDLCRRAVEEGIELARSSGVLIWNSQLFSQGALNALSEADLVAAARYLEQMGGSYRPARRIDACMYHFSTAWLAFLEGQLPRAAEHASTALRLAVAAGTPFHEAISRIALAHLSYERGDAPGAAAHLGRAQEIAGAMRSRILAFMGSLCEADFALRAGAEAEALGALARAMSLGSEQGYVNFYWWRADVMARLCAAALRAGIEVPYVQRLVRLRRLSPPSPRAAGAGWPWPVRIRALGGFEVSRHGAPVTSSRKVQRKPLALLRTLVALGGREVPEERLTDALWPDADGDLARRSLETCLHRLRKLVGHDELVRVRERRVSLDERTCWVDLWAFEDELARVDAAWRDAAAPGAAERALRAGEEAVAAYPGHFLPSDDAPAAQLCRERVRRRFLRLALDTAERLARAREWQRATTVVLRALEVDGGADPTLSEVDLDPARAEATYRRGRAALDRRRGRGEA